MKIHCCFMSNLAEAGSPAVLAIAFLGAGVLVLLGAYKSLASAPLFDSARRRAIVALCIAAMSVIGLLRMSPRSAPPADVVGAAQPARPVLDFVLLPYATLALALIFIFLVFLWSRFARCLMARLSLIRHEPGLRADLDGANEKSPKKGARGGERQSTKAGRGRPRERRARNDRLQGFQGPSQCTQEDLGDGR